MSLNIPNEPECTSYLVRHLSNENPFSDYDYLTSHAYPVFLMAKVVTKKFPYTTESVIKPPLRYYLPGYDCIFNIDLVSNCHTYSSDFETEQVAQHNAFYPSS